MTGRIERIGPHTLILGDCRQLIQKLPTILTALITDPPYGVDFTGKVTKHTDNSGKPSYQDDEQYFRESVLPAVVDALCATKRGAVFSGTRRLQEYPTAADIGGIICPNGGGRSAWGFGCYHPVLFYGRCPYLSGSAGARPTATTIYHPGMHVTGEDEIDHPCPKPIAFMKWLVGRVSVPGDTVLDPFMGSGTTGVACATMGRIFTGIEIDEHYFEIACGRILEATRQAPLDLPEPRVREKPPELPLIQPCAPVSPA